MDTPAWAICLIIVVAAIDIVLKAFALWRAARLNQLTWFVFLFVLNTAGILPIVYLILSDAEYKNKFKK